MNRKVNFSKIKDCGQVWDQMDSCAGGRKCEKCSHVITDFRGMTEWEIALIHAHSTKKVCGLYDPQILEPASPIVKRSRFRDMALVPGIMSLLLTGSQVAALASTPVTVEQSEKYTSPGIVQVENKENIEEDLKIDSLKIVRGHLIDESGENLIGASIIIKGTTAGTITDSDGTFSLDVSHELEENTSITLIIAYVGYGFKEIAIAREDFGKNEIDLQLEPLTIHEDYLILSFVVKRESLPKRIWRGIKNVFRKKEGLGHF